MNADATHGPSDTILVGLDGSEASKAALAWAAGQAKLTGGHLEVVIAWEIPTMTGDALVPYDPVDFARDAHQVLDETLTAVLGDEAGTVDARVIEGHPTTVLMREAEHAALLVVGSRGHGELAGMLLGSVSEYLTTHAPCPVLVYRRSKAAHR